MNIIVRLYFSVTTGLVSVTLLMNFFCLPCISKTTVLISVKIHWHFQYEVKMCILQFGYG